MRAIVRSILALKHRGGKEVVWMKQINGLRAGSSVLAQANLSHEQAVRLVPAAPTPFLALSADKLKINLRTLKRELPGVELYYAMKSNPSAKILDLLVHLAEGVDVASVNEVLNAKAAGFSPHRMLHSHPIKSRPDLEACVREGIQWFTFDNVDEIPKIHELAPGANVLLRMAIAKNSSVVNLSLKFGADERHAMPLIRNAVAAGLRVRGLAFHVGSQCRNPDNYRSALQACRRVFEAAKSEGIEFDVLDIGGGFPIGYRTDVPPLSKFCAVISEGLRTLFPPSLRVIAEPGRCISGDAVTLVVSVIGKALRKGIPWYFIDDGVYGSFSGKLFDLCDYRLLSERPGPRTQCVVAGPTCDSIDVVSRDQLLPQLQIGDLLLVPGMGAYTHASATFFNGFNPAQVLVIEEMCETRSILSTSASTKAWRTERRSAACMVAR
jgi:ornithine decarboxylase